jgi:hypothetical protein
VAEDLNVFVNNVAQQPGAGKSYTATGTTLTFDAAPDAGTNNVYVVYRGLSEGTLRLEQDPNSGITATTGTFSDDLTVDTTTLKVDSTNNRVGIGTASPAATLTVAHTSGNDGRGIRLVNSSNNQTYETRIGTEGIENTSYSIRDMTADAVRLSIDISGRVMMPYQPAFYAWGSGVQNWSGTSVYQILQLSNQHSLGSRSTGYDTSTFTFTAPVTGTYVFFGRMTQTGTATGPSLQLFINGSSTVNEMSIGYGSSYVTVSGFHLVQLAANDAVTLQVINYNTTTFTLDLGRCAFMGWLLG